MKKIGIMVILAVLLSMSVIPTSIAEAPEVVEIPLLTKKNVQAGNVLVSNDEEYLYVTYSTVDNAELKKTKLDIQLNQAGFPVKKKGKPHTKKFAYYDKHKKISEYTYQIPLEEEWLEQGSVVIAAHANVKALKPKPKYDQEGNKIKKIRLGKAWAGDLPFEYKWEKYFEYTITLPIPETELQILPHPVPVLTSDTQTTATVTIRNIGTNTAYDIEFNIQNDPYNGASMNLQSPSTTWDLGTIEGGDSISVSYDFTISHEGESPPSYTYRGEYSASGSNTPKAEHTFTMSVEDPQGPMLINTYGFIDGSALTFESQGLNAYGWTNEIEVSTSYNSLSGYLYEQHQYGGDNMVGYISVYAQDHGAAWGGGTIIDLDISAYLSDHLIKECFFYVGTTPLPPNNGESIDPAAFTVHQVPSYPTNSASVGLTLYEKPVYVIIQVVYDANAP